MDIDSIKCLYLNETGEDNRLNNWKKWINIRKQFHQRMYEIQHRRPSDLALNSAKDNRTIKEVQMLHDYAKIPKILTDRGKPSFWYLPPSSKKFPSLISVMPKPLDFEIPERIIVGVPTHIQREMNTLTSQNPKYSKWFENKYLQNRTKHLQHQIKRIEPHTPKTENLIITGTSYPTKISDTENIDKDTEVQEKDIEYSSSNSYSITDSDMNYPNIVPLISLQIEDAIFIADGRQDIKKCFVFVEFNIGKDECINHSISLSNTGNVRLKYYWQRCFSQEVHSDILPTRLPMYGFTFPKIENIILPNYTNELKIGFITNKRGMYKEVWQLQTSPDVFRGKIKTGEFYLVLHACAEVNNFHESENAIINRIEEGMKYTAIEEALLHILKRTQNLTTEPRDSGRKVTEKDLFEAVNAKFGPPGTLPLIYHYSEPIVKKLKHMYDALKTETDPPSWSYKIEEIENLITKCQSKDEQNFYKFSFNELVKNIFKTNMIENEDRKKYQNIYELLCVMIDQMSEKIYKLRNTFQIFFIETYPAVTKIILVKQEYLDDNCRSNFYFPDLTAEAAIKRIQECNTDELDKPGMEKLKLIPFEDIEQRYKIYQKEKYGIDVDKIKEDSGKKKNKKAKEKKGKQVKNEKENKDIKEVKKQYIRKESIINEKSLTNLLINKVETIPECLEEDYEQTSPNSFRMYHYNLYITIYLLLCQTVNEIECILEHMKSTKKISRQVLRKCIEFGIPTMPASEEEKISQRKFKEMMDGIDSVSSISDLSVGESSKTGLIDISRSYSSYDEEFFKPISSIIADLADVEQEVELVDAQTETDGEELFPLRTQTKNVQTDKDDEEFDLVAQIEKQLSATSVQYKKKPTKDKATQVETCSEFILEDILMGEG